MIRAFKIMLNKNAIILVLPLSLSLSLSRVIKKYKYVAFVYNESPRQWTATIALAITKFHK